MMPSTFGMLNIGSFSSSRSFARTGIVSAALSDAHSELALSSRSFAQLDPSASLPSIPCVEFPLVVYGPVTSDFLIPPHISACIGLSLLIFSRVHAVALSSLRGFARLSIFPMLSGGSRLGMSLPMVRPVNTDSLPSSQVVSVGTPATSYSVRHPVVLIVVDPVVLDVVGLIDVGVNSWFTVSGCVCVKVEGVSLSSFCQKPSAWCACVLLTMIGTSLSRDERGGPPETSKSTDLMLLRWCCRSPLLSCHREIFGKSLENKSKLIGSRSR